jgi:uncharacterized protein
MLRRIGFGLLFAILSGVAVAAPHFPVLTGRVVDDAHILSSEAAQALEQKLAEYEQGTSNQVVVVTLPSLQGASIEDYGYQLGRAWGLGEKGKNNGVLFIVAPKEHKTRIEVGYGLEPVLTDAASSQIIHSVILPAFKAGDMQRGVVEGTQAILDVLGGHGAPIAQQPQDNQGSILQAIIGLVSFGIFLLLATRNPLLALFLFSNVSRYGGSSQGGSSWGGGGFSGGGGSFGGGGASGSW